MLIPSILPDVFPQDSVIRGKPMALISMTKTTKHSFPFLRYTLAQDIIDHDIYKLWQQCWFLVSFSFYLLHPSWEESDLWLRLFSFIHCDNMKYCHRFVVIYFLFKGNTAPSTWAFGVRRHHCSPCWLKLLVASFGWTHPWPKEFAFLWEDWRLF